MAEPKEKPEEEEDPKKLAKAMLIEGYNRDGIIAEIQEITGLPKRTIWAIKGALARSGDIPTKSQLRRMAREKPGPEALKFREEAEGVPFRRPRPPHVLIEGILTQFGVKERAKEIIISRCKRAGGMHPSELERSLMDLDTGVNRKEATYVTEEYYLALQAEEEAAREAGGRIWPMRRGEPGYAGGRYPLRGQPTGGQYGWGYDRGLDRRTWGRYEPGREEPLTMRSLMDILERRERDLEDRMTRRGLEEKIGSLSEDMSVIATELRNLKENPPVTTPPDVLTRADIDRMQADSYIEALKLQMDRLERDRKELMDALKEDRNRFREDLKEMRDTYTRRIEETQKELKEAERRAATRTSTEGYKADEIRLVADGLNRFADVFETRGSPIKILIEGLPKLLGEEGRPPPRERGGPASVADLVGPDYVERD